jgi:phosphate/sulfate permease
MSGYCPDCGNTLCICDYTEMPIIEHQVNKYTSKEMIFRIIILILSSIWMFCALYFGIATIIQPDIQGAYMGFSLLSCVVIWVDYLLQTVRRNK